MKLALLTTTAAVAAAAAPAPAPAATAPCTPHPGSPTCTTWTGKVTFVADGDTLDVDVAGDGTRRPVRVRITGINAMEQTRYSRRPSRRRGACHALEATARLERLVRRSRNRVRLSAQQTGSFSRHRARRYVAVRLGGHWRDVASILLRGGHGLWLPGHAENAWNDHHRHAALAAARAGRNLYDTDACGPGPAADLELAVNWDAEGNDGRNVNGEWFRITNRGPVAVPLGGWWVRDSFARRFVFPSWARVEPNDSVRVHVGRGTGSGDSFFWGQPEPAFENDGDGGYLFDPHGDLRAWDIYG